MFIKKIIFSKDFYSLLQYDYSTSDFIIEMHKKLIIVIIANNPNFFTRIHVSDLTKLNSHYW